MFLSLQQVARLENHGLRFADDVQVQHAGAGGRLSRFDAGDLPLDDLGELFEQRVAQIQGLVYFRVVVVFQHVDRHAVDNGYFFLYLFQVFDLFLREPGVVVVDVFEAGPGNMHEGLGHFIHVIHHLHVVMSVADVVVRQGRQRVMHFVFAVVRRVVQGFRFLHHAPVKKIGERQRDHRTHRNKPK